MESNASISPIVEAAHPDEGYHLASRSFVHQSFGDEFSRVDTNINARHFVLSALKERIRASRFYIAALKEMSSQAPGGPQNETAPSLSSSPYGSSKLVGHHLTRSCREVYGSPACNGIPLNHESKRRGLAPEAKGR